MLCFVKLLVLFSDTRHPKYWNVRWGISQVQMQSVDSDQMVEGSTGLHKPGRHPEEDLRLGKSVNGSTLWFTTALWRKLAGSVSVFNPPVPLVNVKLKKK